MTKYIPGEEIEFLIFDDWFPGVFVRYLLYSSGCVIKSNKSDYVMHRPMHCVRHISTMSEGNPNKTWRKGGNICQV